MWVLIQSLINGIMAGGVYALIAVGVTVIFGVMRVINFASGAFLVTGMYMTFTAVSATGASAYAVFPFTLIAMAIIAYACFKLTMQPVINKNKNASILVTVGLAFFLQNLMIIIYGSTPLVVASEIKTTSIVLGDYTISLARLIAFVVALVLVVITTIIINKTAFGRAMRATSENVETAGMLGINTKRVFSLSWVLGICLIGISGLLLTPVYFTDVSVGNIFRTTSLVAVVLGGLGSIKGAFICSIMLGIVESLASNFLAPDLGPAAVFVVFLIIMLFRPQGLFGKGERVA